MLTSSPLCYHYEKILRNDLLLKCYYNNVMEVPRLRQINLFSQVPINSLKSVSLALEVLCGQKSVEKCEAPNAKTLRQLKSSQKATKNRSSYNIRGASHFHYQVRISLRSQMMYNFLEKLIVTVLRSSSDYTFQIQSNTIQFTLGPSELRLFPEIQNHFEFFESAQNLHIILVTSALTEKETQLLWTGFLQKEI
uniref:Ribosomal protein L5 n=1 Tax=Gonatozygon brebissonii TaxID=184482 RepID=A0A6G9IGI8_9VIRI|nr:ribosomal protein L5 [Gonatozygon brebissonii]QIQ23078.1 ribosomal protein L5 [Gonatozygon brebissonii]